jgi:predicted nuclease of predicted toxin-antitoxin system
VTLRLLADENIPASLIRRLRELEDVEVLWVAEDAPGIDDVEVLRRAVEVDAVVITADHDFGELVIAQRAEAAGVVLIRVHPIRAHLDSIVGAIRDHAGELPGNFVVISSGRVRIRSLSTGETAE